MKYVPIDNSVLVEEISQTGKIIIEGENQIKGKIVALPNNLQYKKFNQFKIDTVIHFLKTHATKINLDKEYYLVDITDYLIIEHV